MRTATATLDTAGRVAPGRQRYWDWRAAANFIAGGSGGGLLLAAAAAGSAGADARAALMAGLALVAAGLFSVWLEIGRPWRALNVLRHLPGSWMSCEAALAPLLFAFGMLALATGGTPYLLCAGALGAAFVYSQARILSADQGIPAWRHARCRPLMVATGLAEGTALLAAAAPLLLPRGIAAVALALVGLLALRAVLWKRYLGGLADSGAPQASLTALQSLDRTFVALGHGVPGCFAIAAALGAPGAPALVATAGLLAAGAGWVLKYTLLGRAAFTQGFALKHLPVRGGAGLAAPAKRGRN